MIEKRFKLAYSNYDWWAICDNENYKEQGIWGQEVVDLMNELNEKNIRFKKQIQELNDYIEEIDGWDEELDEWEE